MKFTYENILEPKFSFLLNNPLKLFLLIPSFYQRIERKQKKKNKANIIFPRKKGRISAKKNNWKLFTQIRKCGLLQITALIKTQRAVK